LDGTLFALMILSRIEDRPLARLRASLTRYGRQRFRAVLDKIINANNRHPSDQGRHALSGIHLTADSLLPYFPATKRAARKRITSRIRRARSHECGGGYGNQFHSCWRYFSA
jgi:hypothetical protein